MVHFSSSAYKTTTDKEIADKAHALVLEDLSRYDTVSAIARKIGTNSSKLKIVFKKNYGISLFQFSRHARIGLAKKLLRETDLTLQVIAELCGYTEGNNFQATFKMIEGCTPGEWRRKQKLPE